VVTSLQTISNRDDNLNYQHKGMFKCSVFVSTEKVHFFPYVLSCHSTSKYGE